jgi:hypothetical protein
MKKSKLKYPLSKDYHRLHKLITEGNEIICFIDYKIMKQDEKEIPIRDICQGKLKPDGVVEFLARGIGYLFLFQDQVKNIDFFCNCCKQKNIEFIEPEKPKKVQKEPIPKEYKEKMVEAYIKVHKHFLKIEPINYNYAGLNECYKKIIAAQKQLSPGFQFDENTMKATFEAILKFAYTQFYGKQLQLSTIQKYITSIIANLHNGKSINNKPTATEINRDSTNKAAALLIGAIRE